MAKELLMTEAGFKALEERLNYLKVEARRDIAEKIKIARDFGDISENSEYDAAKDEQAAIEGEILNIEHQLSAARVVCADEIDGTRVGIGCFVKVFDAEFNEKLEYQVVGSPEANFSENKISNESPLGAALMGHKKGDTVQVTTPQGLISYKIMGISKD